MKKCSSFIPVLFVIYGLFACGGSEKESIPSDRFAFPVDLVYDEAHQNLFVISSNFDLGYKYGNVKGISIGGLRDLFRSPCKTECKDYNSAFIINKGVNIADFAGLALFYNNKIFVSLRRDDCLAVIDVDENGDLSCGNIEEAVLGDCDDLHLIKLPYREPFSIVMRENDSCIYTSFLKDGRVVCIDAERLREEPSLFSDFTNGYEIGGVRDIDISSNAMMASAYAYMMGGRNLIPLSYSFGEKRYTVFLDLTSVIGTAYQESVKLSKAGGRLFMSLRSPNLLLTVDYAIFSDGTFITVDYRLTPLYRYPSRLYVEVSGSLGRELLFAAMEDEDRILVYDTSGMTLLAEIREGLDGPYAMKLINIDQKDYLFVGNFESSTVSVYRAGSDFQFEYLFSIGRPRPKEKGEY